VLSAVARPCASSPWVPRGTVPRNSWALLGVICWFSPPWQSHRCTIVPLALDGPDTSRHRPDAPPSRLPTDPTAGAVANCPRNLPSAPTYSTGAYPEEVVDANTDSLDCPHNTPPAVLVLHHNPTDR